MGGSLPWTGLASVVLTLLIMPVGSQTPLWIGCPVPPTSFSTKHSGAGLTVFRPFAKINYNCTFGFMRTGTGVRTCQEDGTWDGTDDVCRIDASSVALACLLGAMALLIAFSCYCWLIYRSRRKTRQPSTVNRLTIESKADPEADPEADDEASVSRPVESEAGEDGQSNEADEADEAGPDSQEVSEEGNLPTKDGLHAVADRSDSGLPTDEMGGIDLDVFDVEEDPWN